MSGPERLVLVGVGGAEGLALTIALGSAAPACGGVLVCGRTLPQFSSLVAPHYTRPVRVRLVLATDDPYPVAAVMSDFLRDVRAHGLDAKGIVISDSLDRAPHSPAMVRMGASYLAELVAFGLAT
jgi:hypothetical protein